MARTKQSAHRFTGGKHIRRKAKAKEFTTEDSTTPQPNTELGDGIIEQQTQTKERKPHKYRPGTVALRQIRSYQRAVNLLIPKLPFQRLCRDIAKDIRPDLRFQAAAVEAIQESAEAYIISVFEDANLCAIHARRVTMMARDIRLARRLRSDRT